MSKSKAASQRVRLFKQATKKHTVRPLETLYQSEPFQKYNINGIDFEGTGSDIARLYCLANGIELYIFPDEDNPLYFSVFAVFKEKPDKLIYIVTLDGAIDLETAYTLFFEEFIQKTSSDKGA